MHIPSRIKNRMFQKGMRMHIPSRLLISLAFLGLLFQPGCLFRKHKPPAAPNLPAPVRIAMLPMNVPQGNTDLRWVAIATIVLLEEVAMAAPDLEPLPIWESMPSACQSLGDSRTVTTDIAELTAARLSARWTAQGDLLASSNVLTLRLDFIPAKPSLVPFRFEKQSSIDELTSRFHEAYDQFLRYLIVRPLDEDKIKPFDAKKLKELADAIDVEYGWFVTAKPGAAGRIVEDLARSNPGLARLLFSPTLYPVLGK